jgi:hypothetical protein
MIPGFFSACSPPLRLARHLLRALTPFDIDKTGPVGAIHAIAKSCNPFATPVSVIRVFEHHQAMEIQHGVDLERHTAITDIHTSAQERGARRVGTAGDVGNSYHGIKRTAFVPTIIGRLRNLGSCILLG